MPSMVTSSDLFDGDLLGDELIDIYNAAVVDGGDDDGMNELPSLLGSTNDVDEKESCVLSHPGDPDTQMSMDDGLGSFRASTSFNDLATMLPATPATDPAPVVASAPVELASPSGSKKRTPEGTAPDNPAPKRRPSGGRKNSSGCGASSKSKAKVSAVAATTVKDKVATAFKTKIGTPTQPTKKAGNDTPNPLSSVRTAPVPAAAAAPKVPMHVKAVGQAIQVAPSVVSPRDSRRIEDTASAGVPDGPAPVVSGAATEADFKSVAVAAVSSLMVSAATATKTDSSGNTEGTEDDTKVDTSTEHIKALTGANWVAVCAGGDIGAGESVSSGNNDKGNNRARRQNLTPDERARQNRDRNREHARNTRLRKKAYVEELKRTLTELVAQRDSADLEKRHTAQRELEQREVRFRVIEEFLKLRGRNEPNFARWAAILEDSFSFTFPITTFRKMVHLQNGSPRREVEQVLTGVSEAMTDSSYIASFLQTLGKDSNAARTPISFSYSCDRKHFFMDNCNAVLEWTATSSGAIQQGAPSELTIKGTVRANFSPASNKLISAVVSYDTGIILSQLEHIFSHSKMNTENNEVAAAAAAAAQVAACEADAILDSLQMPHIEASVPANVTVQLVPPSSCSGSSSGESVTSLEKDESELFLSEGADQSAEAMTTRRILRSES